MTKRIVRQILFLGAVILFFSPIFLSAAETTDAPADPYLAWTGPEYPWPNGALPSLSVKMRKTEVIEGVNGSVIALEGDSLSILLDGFGPFYLPDPGVANVGRWKNSLVMKCRNDASAVFAFTHFDKESFFPELTKDSLMGYGKWLEGKSNPNGGEIVTVIGEPAELARKQMLMSRRPLLLTWERKTPAGASTKCIDIFFELDDGTILVASVVSGKQSFAGVCAAAMDLLRHAVCEKDDDAVKK